MERPIVLKIGGNELDQPGFVDQLAQTIAKSPVPLVLVHGGGKEISHLQEQLGIIPHYIDGLRVSDEASLGIAEMVLVGKVNSRLVRTLQQHGVEAQGLTGMDRGLIRARKLHHPQGDLGRVGEPIAVRGEVVLQLLGWGVTPVIAPICLGEDGGPLNVNADHVAGAVAKAIGAEKVIFATNVRGVLHNDQHIPTLNMALAEQLIDQQVIYGGMLPKVRTAQQLVAAGVPQVVITNLAGFLLNEGTAVIC